jgi:hypothetical protein
MIQGLRIQQPKSTVPTSDLLGMADEWPSPIPLDIHSINPFDNLAPVPTMDYHYSQTQYPPSMASTDTSHARSSATSMVPSEASILTNTEVHNHIHVTHNGPQDRFPFNPGLFTHRFPIKVFFLKRFVYRRAPGLHVTVFRWHIRLEEAFPRAFAQWQIALSPGEYYFEDFGNSLIIVAQKSGSEPILFTFPIASSSAWPCQGIHQNGCARPLTYSDSFSPCYLPCTASRGPRIGSFLHPSCYGVSGDHEGIHKKSHQAYYVPTSVLKHNGLIITQVYA